MKLFNLLLEEMGPALLDHGIVLDRGDALGALGNRAETLAELPAEGEVDLRVRVTG